MKRKYRALLGSSRSRIYREPSARKKSFRFRRKQSVRLRARSATDLLLRSAKRIAIALGVVVLLAAGFYGFTKARTFWYESGSLRIKSISFKGDVPVALQTSLNLKPGQNILAVNLSALESEMLKQFPELRSLSIQRTMERDVVVKGEFRRAIAIENRNGALVGVDAQNNLFPIVETKQPIANLPIIKYTFLDDRVELLQALEIWEGAEPEFFTVVKFMEIDRMRQFSVVLTDDVIVDWGALKLSGLAERANQVMEIRKRFEPSEAPAKLKFVADNRIVMNANWKSVTKN